VKDVGSNLSPGGTTKTIDFTIGGYQPRAEDEQVCLTLLTLRDRKGKE
jgi:hypothetical protein